jgi:hypothetical protein
MSMDGTIDLRVLVMMAIVLVASAGRAVAQTDEIQVYDAEIEELGTFNVMVHSNFAPIGRTKPDFPGEIIPNSIEQAGRLLPPVRDRRVRQPSEGSL